MITIAMMMAMTMTMTAICESLMLIGNGRIGKIPETGKTGHKIGEIYKMGADIRDRGGGQIGVQRITFGDIDCSKVMNYQEGVARWHDTPSEGAILLLLMDQKEDNLPFLDFQPPKIFCDNESMLCTCRYVN